MDVVLAESAAAPERSMTNHKTRPRVLYSYPMKLGATRICYTAWQCVKNVAAAGAEVILCSNGGKKSLQRSYSKHEAEGTIAVIRIKPVDTRTEEESHNGGDCFMPSAGNLKIDFVLALQLDLAVSEPSR
jgi:hypothetical protein